MKGWSQSNQETIIINKFIHEFTRVSISNSYFLMQQFFLPNLEMLLKLLWSLWSIYCYSIYCIPHEICPNSCCCAINVEKRGRNFSASLAIANVAAAFFIRFSYYWNSWLSISAAHDITHSLPPSHISLMRKFNWPLGGGFAFGWS